MNVRMEVKVHVATISVLGKEMRVDKRMAAQFPILLHKRSDQAAEGEPGDRPIGKVLGKSIGVRDLMADHWYYLVPDEEAGLAWAPAVMPDPQLAERIIEQGGWVDHPEEVPTLVL
jgi:hypothetical protein